MTLDATIGKVYVDQYENTPLLRVKECPPSKKDICPKEHTVFPKRAYRSGSSSLWEFFLDKNEELKKIYFEMREHPNSNDLDVKYLKPFANRIYKLKASSFKFASDKDRLKWLKYWARVAIRLYGDEAGISFG